MKKYFIVFLASIVCSLSLISATEAKSTSASHNHCSKSNYSHHNHGCNGNCSNTKVLTYIDNFDETLAFSDCKDHSLVKHTQILHYSDGTTHSIYRYKILGSDGGIIADNLYHTKHFVNSQGKHYFLVKSSDYNKRNYVIMDTKGNVSHTKGYGKYKILNRDSLIVQQDKKYGIVDFDNNIILDIKYKSIEDYDNVLLTKYNGYYGLTDKNGNLILNNKYDKISKYGNVFILKYQNKYGIANLKGEILYEPCFDSIKQDGDYLKVRNNNKYGIIDTNGKLISSAKYKKVRVERNIPQVCSRRKNGKRYAYRIRVWDRFYHFINHFRGRRLCYSMVY